MLKPLMRLLVVGFALAAVLAGSSSPVPLAPAPSAAAVGDCIPGANWGTPRQDLTARVIDLVNQHRAALGLVALKVSPTLTPPRSGRRGTWRTTTTAARRPGAAGLAALVPARAGMRLRGRGHGREHRLRLPDPAGRHERLAQLAGPQGQHRERELPRDRRRRRRLDGSSGRRTSAPWTTPVPHRRLHHHRRLHRHHRRLLPRLHPRHHRRRRLHHRRCPHHRRCHLPLRPRQGPSRLRRTGRGSSRACSARGAAAVWPRSTTATCR